MAYATYDDLLKLASEQRLIELTDRAVPPAGQVDQDVVTAALDDAAALIDSYLAGRYTLPLAPVPPALRRAAAVIAYYNLSIEDAPPKVQSDYDQARTWLRDLAAGRVQLAAPGGADAPAAGGIAVRAAPRVFPHERLREFTG